MDDPNVSTSDAHTKPKKNDKLKGQNNYHVNNDSMQKSINNTTHKSQPIHSPKNRERERDSLLITYQSSDTWKSWRIRTVN